MGVIVAPPRPQADRRPAAPNVPRRHGAAQRLTESGRARQHEPARAAVLYVRPAGRLAGPVLDGLAWAWPCSLARAPAQSGDTVTIAITGSVTRTWRLLAAASGWQFGDQPGPAAGDQQPARGRMPLSAVFSRFLRPSSMNRSKSWFMSTRKE